MTKKEKKENPNFEFIGGYLKAYGYKEAFRISFEAADIDDIKKTLDLPNFDYEIFEEISGISKSDFARKLGETHEKESVFDDMTKKSIKLLQDKNILGNDFRKWEV